MKKKLLFVDDELYLLHGLRRMLRNMKTEWELFYAHGGEEALDILCTQEIDIVVSDLLMPQMNGAELLEEIASRYPETVRIILSGTTDKNMLMLSTGIAHQFINKPVDIEFLINTLIRIFKIRDLLGKKSINKISRATKGLPSLPVLYDKLLRELHSPEPSLKKIASIISQDPIMTARVLQIVNSAFFALPHRINNVQQAVALLGLDTLKALVVYANILSSLDQVSCPLNLKSLWEHSSMVGKIAGIIVHEEFHNKEVAEEAIIAGMLHDIGYLILAQIPDIFNQLTELLGENEYTLLEAEYQLMDVSHAEIGAYLLGIWGFPDSIVQVVDHHHKPSCSDNSHSELLTAVHMANCLLPGQSFFRNSVSQPRLDITYLEKADFLRKVDYWEKYMEQMSGREYY